MHRFPLLLALLCLPARAPASSAPLLSPLAPAVQGARAEFKVENLPPYAVDNPLDPDQIAIDADVTAPSGGKQTVPLFWFQDYALDPSAGPGAVRPVGPPEWRLRYTPDEAGAYQVRVHWTVKGVLMPPVIQTRVDVAARRQAPGSGWVRVAADHRSFETSDGRPLRLIGANVCWPEGQGVLDFDRWFQRMSGAGENFARLWLCPWWAGLEHRPGTLNRYPLDEAWKLDHVFQQADERGIYLLLSLDHHGMYQTDNKNWGGNNNYWRVNPYSRVQGGPCETPNDFFTSAAARAIYEKRLRYLVARYGYSPRLLAWQFFNEIDNVFGHGLNGPDVVAWHRDVGAWLKTHDPFGHLVTTSLTGGSDRPEMWAVPQLDFSDYHSYQDPALGRKIAALSEDFVRRYHKPVLIDEFGVSAASWSLAIDPYLRGFRQALWSGVVGGSVGTSMSWWWQDIDRDDVYPLYASLHRVMTAAGWDAGSWVPARVDAPSPTPTELAAGSARADVFDASLALNGGRRLALSGVVAVASPLAAERASEALPRFIYGAKNPDLPQALVLVANLAPKARLHVRVNSAASDNQLVIRVSGAEVLRRRFAACPARDPSSRDADYEIETELPEGPQRIEIANEGADLTSLDAVRLSQVRAVGFRDGWDFKPEVAGIRNGTTAVLYLTSPWVVYPAGALRFHPPRVKAATVTLRDWPDGTYDADWVAPATGEHTQAHTVARAAHGSVTFTVPSFDEDLVGIIRPQEVSSPPR